MDVIPDTSMDIFLHNTLTKTNEPFKPIKQGKVGIYSCGPTVYDRIHIGNLRSFLFPDILRRLMTYAGYDVTLIRNITDVDDKTIRRSREEKISLKELTEKYEKTYFDDLALMNILPPSASPRATENIPEMIVLIEKLLAKKIAYAASDGIYFSISKSPKGYGLLAGMTVAESEHQKERIANDEYDKENPHDFALWKFWNEEDDGDTFWEAPFGKGRPGWHIECSAMSTKYLDQPFDIHTGGVDLLFPHHTNEIAQSEAAEGKPLAHYWLHNEHILVDGKKMSKSAQNFFTLEDIVAKGISPLAFRYWLLSAHYRTLVNVTWDSLMGSNQGLKRLVATLSTLEDSGSPETSYKNRFNAIIGDDLDTPKALALISEILKDGTLRSGTKKATILEMDTVLGLMLKEQAEEAKKTLEIPEAIQDLLNEREEARKAKNWTRADEIRQTIGEKGFEILDTEAGAKLQKLSPR